MKYVNCQFVDRPQLVAFDINMHEAAMRTKTPSIH